MGGGGGSHDGCEGADGIDQILKRVLAGEVYFEIGAVVVGGIDDEHAVAHGAHALVLSLVAADEEIRPPRAGEGVEDVLGLIASPDEAVDGTVAGEVGIGEVAAEDGVIEAGQFAGAGEGMGKEDPGEGDGGEGHGVDEIAIGDVGLLFKGAGLGAEMAAEAFGEVVTVLHDGLALDLCEVVVGEEEMDLAGVFFGPGDGVEEHVEGGIGAVGADGTAVDEFLENDVAVPGGAEVCGGLEALEVAVVVVEIAGDEEFA